MVDGARKAPGRSVILALVLSGLGPGAGHVYVGAPRRGLALVLLWIVASLAWTTQVSASYTAARLWGLPAALALLGLIVDSGRLARRAPRPFPLGALQRWWCYALIVLATGFAIPTALTRALERQAGLATLRDSGMEPQLQALDRIVIRPGTAGLERGGIVVLESEGARRVRRVVGLPGESVELRGGHVYINAQPWLQDPTRLTGLSREGLREIQLRADEFLVLPDQRLSGATENPVVRAADLVGTARWVLLPADLDPLRVGASIH